MKKLFKYIRLILLFIVVDAFVRSLMPSIHLAKGLSVQNPFLENLLFYTGYFILFHSWFYWPIAMIFLLISKLLKKQPYIFIVSGLLTALLFYLTYCKLYSILEVWRPEFYIRIVMYSLMGAYFGSVRFKTMDKTL